jgi:NAD(P)-dependent dehydrogenase (short-subunit alcohol dehydrogenase family)
MEGAPYTIAKTAIVATTRHIAIENGSRNIRAYTLALGNIATDAIFYSMTKQDRNKAAREPVMKRWGSPAEVARVGACLASESFSFATGNTIIIDGGKVLKHTIDFWNAE